MKHFQFDIFRVVFNFALAPLNDFWWFDVSDDGRTHVYFLRIGYAFHPDGVCGIEIIILPLSIIIGWMGKAQYERL